MSKKNRPYSRPAIGKNEQRELNRWERQMKKALDNGMLFAYYDAKRRYDKLKRHYESRGRR